MVHVPSHDPLSSRLLDQDNVESINPAVALTPTQRSLDRAYSTATVAILNSLPSSSSFDHQPQRSNHPRQGDIRQGHLSKSNSLNSISTRDGHEDEDEEDEDEDEDEVGDELQPVLAAAPGRAKANKKPTIVGE
jgi:hypothetical protein